MEPEQTRTETVLKCTERSALCPQGKPSSLPGQNQRGEGDNQLEPALAVLTQGHSPTGLAKIRVTTPSVDRDVGQLDLAYTAAGNINC